MPWPGAIVPAGQGLRIRAWFLTLNTGSENLMSTHYHKKRSLKKRVRKHGFRNRMKTKRGRDTINRKRRVGRSLKVRRVF